MKPATPLPWKLEYHPTSGRFTGDVLAPNGSEICTTWGHAQHRELFDKEANAAYIVHACNLHPELVTALEASNALLTEIYRERGVGEPLLVSWNRAILARCNPIPIPSEEPEIDPAREDPQNDDIAHPAWTQEARP